MTPQRRAAPNAAEWTVFFIAAALVAAVAAVLVVDWLGGSDLPAAFDVRVAGTSRIASLHHVEVEVTNSGGESAAEVTVTAELDTGDDVVELDEIITFLSPDETAKVTFIFEDDPADGELAVDVTSYREP